MSLPCTGYVILHTAQWHLHRALHIHYSIHSLILSEFTRSLLSGRLHSPACRNLISEVCYVILKALDYYTLQLSPSSYFFFKVLLFHPNFAASPRLAKQTHYHALWVRQVTKCLPFLYTLHYCFNREHASKWGHPLPLRYSPPGILPIHKSPSVIHLSTIISDFPVVQLS